MQYPLELPWGGGGDSLRFMFPLPVERRFAIGMTFATFLAGKLAEVRRVPVGPVRKVADDAEVAL